MSPAPKTTGLLLLALALGVGCRISGGADSDPKFDGDRAFLHLLRQCDFGPRVPGSKGHEEVLRYLEDELGKSADQVRRQPFTHTANGKRLDLTNLIATFNPSGKERVLLCAHWDTRPTADQEATAENRSKPILGANDGASGVAILLELARLLNLKPPRQQVMLVFFDGEDYGPGEEDMLLGSRYFARQFRGPKPEWGVLLDMVGAKDLRLRREGYSQRLAPGVVKRIWQTAARLGVQEFEDREGAAIVDDHLPLLRAGIRCIDLIDTRYPYWHTLGDTPDKCSARSLEAVGKVLWAALGEED